MASKISTTVDLMIGQWRGSPALLALLQSFLDGVRSDLDEASLRFELMQKVDTAEGVFLDYIAERIGIKRPFVTDNALDPRFGFDDAGEGFDNVPYKGEGVNDAVFPMGDAVFRKLLKARIVLLFADGSYESFRQAVHMIDPSANVQDMMNMKARVVTNFRDQFEAADKAGALPRPAGVALDDAGVQGQAEVRLR